MLKVKNRSYIESVSAMVSIVLYFVLENGCNEFSEGDMKVFPTDSMDNMGYQE